jgi:hypothetical protein
MCGKPRLPRVGIAATVARLMGRRTKRVGTTITRMRAIVTAAVAAGAIAAFGAPGAAHAQVPDAYCSGPPTNVAGFGDHDGGRWAETFSPINGGYLSEVRLFVEEELHISDILKVQITAVNSSDLSPVFPVVPLAEATVPDNSIPANPNYPYLTEVAFDFPNPPPVNASGEYAIVLSRSDTSGVLGIGVVGTGAGPDLCPDGALYGASGGPSDPWGAPLGHDDAVFTTSVGGPPAPPASNTGTGKRAAALKKCKKKKSNRARAACKKKARKLPV